MKKTLNVSIIYWVKNSKRFIEKKEVYDATTKKMRVINERWENDYIEVENVRTKPNNEVMVLLKGQEKEIKFENNACLLVGGLEIDPLKSYMCNEWNIMLPMITYK